MVKIILLAVLILIIAALFWAGWYFFRFAVVADNGKWSDSESPRGPYAKYFEERKVQREQADALECEHVWITSRDGLKLHARWVACESAKRIVVCCHGFHGSGSGDFCAIIPMIRDDSSLLIIDERCHGQSEGKYITFGAKEKLDIQDWVKFTAGRNEKNLPVYLFGVSMGSASVLMNTDLEQPSCVKGVIGDCGYTSMFDITAAVAKKWFHTPSFPVISILGFWCFVKGGFRMKDADAYEALQHAKLPVLLIHGDRDSFVGPENSVRNNEACISEHEVLFVEGAPHGCSANEAPDLYKETVYRFFGKYDS